MKKIKLYILSFLFLFVFALSLNKSFMEWWADFRTYQLHIPFTLARYGDLYSGCFLPHYIDTAATKKLREYKSHYTYIDLYVIHDSYLASKIKKENFLGVDKLILSDFRGRGIEISTDKHKRNILIIECSERSTWHLSDVSEMYSKLRIRKSIPTNKRAHELNGQSASDYFFNPNINNNLEFNLFDYELFKSVKEAKARLNFNLFERLPKDIAVSSDKNYLLLNETVDPNFIGSSFRWISNEELDFIAQQLNRAKEHFKNAGFDEIYFSIIPNPVSIIDAGRLPYNHKIERIETNWFINTEYIDVYQKFKKSKQRIYRRDDTHWNSLGVQIWVDEVNSKITSH